MKKTVVAILFSFLPSTMTLAAANSMPDTPPTTSAPDRDSPDNPSVPDQPTTAPDIDDPSIGNGSSSGGIDSGCGIPDFGGI